MSKTIEQGDIYFFYRNRVNIDKASSLDDIQRTYIVLVPDDAPEARLLVVGKKRLPEIVGETAKPSQREWAMVIAIDDPGEIGLEIAPIIQQTKTKGKRHIAEAIPAGVGRYSIILNDDHDSRLVYQLKYPEKIGKAQKELGILSEASFVISIRNPDAEAPGFPEEKPDYPQSLLEKFDDINWLPVLQKSLLDYEFVQVVLIGARDQLNEAERQTIVGEPDLFGKLKLDKKQWPTASLEQGAFAKAGYEPDETKR